jgi:hypothetical protein
VDNVLIEDLIISNNSSAASVSGFDLGQSMESYASCWLLKVTNAGKNKWKEFTALQA